VGTALVADVFPGATASDPQYLTLAGTNLFFLALDPTHGYELWRRDETTGVVSAVQDVVASSLAEYQGSLIFWGNNVNVPGSGDALWKSDGTMAGTMPYQSFGAPAGSNPRLITANGSEAYFVASTISDVSQIWKSDGTLAGTQPLTAFAFPSLGFIDTIRSAAGKTFFTMSGSLFVTPGESTSVELIGQTVSSSSLTVLGAFLLFEQCGGQGCGLWRTDGTIAGTQQLSSFPQQGGIGSGSIVPYGGGALFILNNLFPYQLWKTDGAPSGTGFVKQLTDSSSLNYGVVYHGLVYFTSNFPDSKIWESDGTDMGTQMVIPLNASNLTVVNDTLFFSAYDPTTSLSLQTGVELWMSDGTQSGTHLVKDIDPGPDGSYPSQLVGLDGILYFTAVDGTHGVELWRSDGTATGTSLVADLRPDAESSLISSLTVSGGKLFFSASTLAEGFELWKSNGTPGGTVLVKDINLGPASSSPLWLTDVSGILFFAAFDPVHGQELWTSDGTPGGTSLVRDINPSLNSSQPNSAFEVGGLLYFSANDSVHGFELWKSDGTGTGTTLFSDLYPGPASSGARAFTRLGNRLVFSAIDETRGRKPWITDFTPAGTLVLKDINPGPNSSYPLLFTEYKGSVYFIADDGIHGRQLCVSDGTPVGTVPPPFYVADPTSLFVAGSYLFIIGASPGLWRTDGTGPGTIGLATIDITTNPVSIGGEVFFANSGLWKTDGTSGGTLKIETTPFFLLGASGGAIYGFAWQNNTYQL
jgi:ELWxxDGT repeat protein